MSAPESPSDATPGLVEKFGSRGQWVADPNLRWGGLTWYRWDPTAGAAVREAPAE